MPAYPGVGKLGAVAAAGEDIGKFIEVQAFAGLAVFAFSVGTLHAGDDAGDFGAERRIGGCGDGQRDLQQVKLALQVGRQLQTGETLRLFDQVDLQGDGTLVSLGGEHFRVVGNVSRLDPVGASAVDVYSEETGLGVLDKLLGIGYGGGSGEGGDREGNEQNTKTEHAPTIA